MAHLGGQTMKQTYVTTYTTDVDPRTLTDFETRGVVPGERRSGAQYVSPSSYDQQGHRRPPQYSQDPPPPHHGGAPPHGHGYHQHLPTSYQDEDGLNSTWASTSPAPTLATSSADSADNGSSHRLRKKYTTTTVTTITTTTILLPKMQEAYVLPPVTSHQPNQQHSVEGPGNPRTITGGDTYEDVQPLERHLYKIDSSSDRSSQLQEGNSASGNCVVPSRPQFGPNGEGSKAWEFRQHTSSQVETQENRGRLPTLQDLGITSYFVKDTSGNGSAVPQRREAPYAPEWHGPRNSTTPLLQQPWVAAETRYEVEGGKRYC
uniref:Uncharacterized protein n=1 Tax=Leishmania guyanensis TaxID=5670 RepID=A0A1E1ISE0_LEIGU|nr:Hypothetical protein BN36_1616940 [Leishmania guyanensis]